MSSTNLLDCSPAELESLAESLGAPRYRGRQLARWIFGRGVVDLDRMSDLPRELRTALAAQATVVLPEVVPTRWWQNLLHGQTALYFKRLLLFEPHVVVTSVPLHLRSPEQTGDPAAALLRR